MKRLNIVYLMMVVSFTAFSQEVITGLTVNPAIRQAAQADQELLKTRIREYTPRELPFIDDFSADNVYPDQHKWTDRDAFVNPDYALFPVNYGMATLDVLDALGNVYQHASTTSFTADHLTSYPIRLDSIFDVNLAAYRALTPADSVYLSFYYQPQGRGIAPASFDSLVLEFGIYNGDSLFSYIDSLLIYIHDLIDPSDSTFFGPGDTLFPGDLIYIPCDMDIALVEDTLIYTDSLFVLCDSVFVYDSDWKSIWHAEGDSVEVFVEENDAYFKRVMIPITDSIWFDRNFRFRFKNYGSISTIPSWKSNTDQWNLDVVYLNFNRSRNDTTLRDISFVERPPSFLDGYQAMPYRQYQNDFIAAMRDSVSVLITNLDSISHSCHYRYLVVRDGADTIPAFNYDGGTAVLDPFWSSGYSDYQPFSNPVVKTYFPFNPLEPKDSVVYTISHIVTDDSGWLGDTARLDQIMTNYYAYDDGTAEVGYGLTPAGSKLGYKFTLYKPDTLRAVKLYFNKTLSGTNSQYFYIKVWDDYNGMPGDEIYSEENVLPQFSDEINAFHTYHLKNDSLLLTGTFYIGWEQTTGHNLNLGFDLNNDSRSKIFYNVDGDWTNSKFNGSLMIRPVFGKRLRQVPPTYKLTTAGLNLHPNPPAPNGKVYIRMPDHYNNGNPSPNLSVGIYNIFGQEVYSSGFPDDGIAVMQFRPGIYLVRVSDRVTGEKFTGKLIIRQ